MFSGMNSGFLNRKSNEKPKPKNTVQKKAVSPPKLFRSDYHCWVKRKDGSIYDPYFPEYDMIKSIQNIKPNAKQHYLPIEDKQEFDSMWTWIFEHSIKPKLKQNTLQEFRNEPKFSYCWLNAYAYHIVNDHSKIEIGKMGWEKDDGIWWEFG